MIVNIKINLRQWLLYVVYTYTLFFYKQPVYKQQGLKLDVAQATEGSNDDTLEQQSIYILTIFHILGKI